MPDREKVILGLEACRTGDCTAKSCPYARQAGCLDLLFQDAITLLKEQAREEDDGK